MIETIGRWRDVAVLVALLVVIGLLVAILLELRQANDRLWTLEIKADSLRGAIDDLARRR